MQEMKDSDETFFIELYVIELRTGTVRIAACDENIMFAGEEYMAVPFQRQNIVRSMDSLADSCEIVLGNCNEDLLAFVMNGFDFRGCTATVFRIMYPDSLSDPNIVQWVFSGYIDNPSFSSGVFTCKIMSRFPEVECPNRTYQLACNCDFGDEDCTMSLEETTTTVKSREGNTLTVSISKSKDYWKNGVVTVQGETRIIESSEGDKIVTNINFIQNEIEGKKAVLCRGCNKTKEDCKRHGNTQHYSGFPAIPFESIYR